MVRELCRSGCGQNVANFQLNPSHCVYFDLFCFVVVVVVVAFLSLPTFLSLTQVTVFEISALLKLVSVPFSKVYNFVTGHLEKRFPESIMQTSEMGQS